MKWVEERRHGQFSIWNTDSNGNFLSSRFTRGTSTAMRRWET